MFRKIELTDKPWIESCRDENVNALTVLSFPAVYTWQSSFGLTIDGDDSFYVIKDDAEHGYYYPVGDKNSCRGFVTSMLARRQPLKLLYVPESELEWLEELGGEIICDPDTSEYVYSSQALALNNYDAGRNYREKVRHFSRDNIWTLRELHFPEDEAFLREKTRLWDQMTDVHEHDRDAVLSAVEAPAALGLSGIYIENDQGGWGYLLGYRSTSKIYDMSFVKYTPDISRNVVPACFCELAKIVCGTFPYINLEDDLGVPGLRNMKKLYRPLFLLDSYTVCF